jgi:ABC-type amino acid transport system permease subunit
MPGRVRRGADRNGGHRTEPATATLETSGGGSKGISLAIAGTLVTLFAGLPFVMAVALYTFVTIYAIVRAIGPGRGEDPVAIVVGFVLIASALAVSIAASAYLLGRAITPRKRRERSDA